MRRPHARPEKVRKMKKKLITILIILAAVCALGTGALTAHAENGKANGDNAETRLLLPSSYEQYLGLENPSDFAVNDRYIAVADSDMGAACSMGPVNRSAPDLSPTEPWRALPVVLALTVTSTVP